MARSQVLQMCEEVASRVERAARRLRPPAWFRAAAASPRGFLLAARRPSRLPPWPLPPIQQPPPTTDGAQQSHSGSRSAPATLTRRRDRDRHRGSDVAEEETWSRDAATLYATPLSSRRSRPQPDWQTTPLGSWDSTPPRRHRSQLTLRTASPAASSDAGWSQEVRRPYLGWRSLERLSRRPWTPEERLAASLLERSGRSTPTYTKEAAVPKKHSSGTQQHQSSGGDTPLESTAASFLRQESAPKATREGTMSSLRKESVLNASRRSPAGSSLHEESAPYVSREATTASSLRKQSAPLPTLPVASARTEHTTHNRNQLKEPSNMSMQLTTLSFLVNERNCEAETTSSFGKKSNALDEMSTGNLASRAAEEDTSWKRHSENKNPLRLEQDTLPNVSSYPEVHGLKTPQHNGLLLSTQIKTLPGRRTDPDVDLAQASHQGQTTDTQYFPWLQGDTLGRTLHREKSPVKETDRASRDTKEEKTTTMKHLYLNGASQLPTQLKALSVTTHYTNDDGGMSANADKHFQTRDLLARSYDASNIQTSANAISGQTISNWDDQYLTTNHLNSTSSPSPHDRNFTTDQSPASDGGDIRAKWLPTVELRTRSFEVTLPQRVTTSDTSRKLSIHEQFYVAEDRAPSVVQDDPSLVIMPLVKKTATAPPATHISSTCSSTANRKSAPAFPPIAASPSAATDTKTLPYQVQFHYTSDTTSPSANGPKPFDINHLRSVELRTRSVEIPLPQINSVITDAPDSNFSPSVDAKNSSLPNIKEGSPQSSATTRAVSMPPVPRDRTFIIESPTVFHKRSSTYSPLPAVEFQSPPSDVTLLQEVSTVATPKAKSHRQEADPISSGPTQRHSLSASPLVETSLTTIHVSQSPEVVEYQSVYSGSSPLLGRKPFTIKHVEPPVGHRTKSSAENTKSREISLSSALPKPFEPMLIPNSKIPVPIGSKSFSEKETAVTSETSHKAINHIHPSDRAQKSSLPVTPVIRRPSYRVATRNELNPSTRKKRSAAGVNFAEVLVSSSVGSPAENSRTKVAPVAKPPRLRTKNNATSTPKQSPRQKHPTSALATERSDNVGPVPHDMELHPPNGMSPLPYSALRILDSQLPQNTTGPANTISVSFKLPVSSESGAAPAKVTVSKQSMSALQHVPDPTLLTPLKYKPCTTTDL